MIIYIVVSLFVFFVISLSLILKKQLYVNEHEASIQKEIIKFEHSIKVIENLNNIPNYKLGSGHLYENRE